MSVKETITFDGREVFLEWFETSNYPKGMAISQVAGFCFNERGEVLVIKNKRGWGFPGGHPEKGEAAEEALRREIWEEASVTIKKPRLVGCLDIRDPRNESIEGKHYAQLRYLAKVDKIADFKKEFETSDRLFVPVSELSKYIDWLSGPTGSAQYETLLKLSRFFTLKDRS